MVRWAKLPATVGFHLQDMKPCFNYNIDDCVIGDIGYFGFDPYGQDDTFVIVDIHKSNGVVTHLDVICPRFITGADGALVFGCDLLTEDHSALVFKWCITQHDCDDVCQCGAVKHNQKIYADTFIPVASNYQYQVRTIQLPLSEDSGYYLRFPLTMTDSGFNNPSRNELLMV